jgi:hypothetical protein
MHTPILLMALLLLAPTDRFGYTGAEAVYMERDPSGTGAIGPADSIDDVLFYPDDPSMPVCLVNIHQCDVRHASDPATPLTRHDTLGRTATLVAPRYLPGDGVRDLRRGTITVTSGLTPKQWSAALSLAYDGPPVPEGDRARTLVELGLGHRDYRTREAALHLLVRLGADSVPALIQRGVKNADPEIADRSEMALDSILTGISQ